MKKTAMALLALLCLACQEPEIRNSPPLQEDAAIPTESACNAFWDCAVDCSEFEAYKSECLEICVSRKKPQTLPSKVAQSWGAACSEIPIRTNQTQNVDKCEEGYALCLETL